MASASRVLLQMGLTNFVVFPAGGIKGGIIMMWRNKVDVEVTSCEENFINAIIYSNPPHHPWMFTGVYAPSEWFKKESFWLSLFVSAENFRGS